MPLTTTILGAGASADFGFPLGGGLFGEVRSALAGFRSKYKAADSKRSFFYADHVRQWVQGNEFSEQLCRSCEKPDGGIDFSPVFKLIDMMEEAPAYTIDTLAMERPEFTEVCRVATAEVLINRIRSMITGERHAPQKWAFCSRELKLLGGQQTQTNWMTLFVSAMRTLLRISTDEKFCFVSFNYDRIAENGMRRIWQNASNDLGSFDDHVEFTYPHGSVHWDVDDNGYSTFSVTRSPIVFAHTKASQDSFDEAVKWLSSSQRVISLGFNFSPENTHSLQLKKSLKKVELVYQNYDQNPGLDRRVSALEVAKTRAFSGGIASAMLRGEIGELPT